MQDDECVQFLQWAVPQLHMRWPGFRKVRRQVCKRLQRRINQLGLDEAVDFEKARKILGPNYCLMGNVSTTLMAMGSPEEVKEATKEVIRKAGKNGHLLVSGGCLIAENCPPENMRAMVKAAKEYRL